MDSSMKKKVIHQYLLKNIKKAYYVDLKEEYADSIEIVDNTVQVKPLTHCKFTTIYVETEYRQNPRNINPWGDFFAVIVEVINVYDKCLFIKIIQKCITTIESNAKMYQY